MNRVEQVKETINGLSVSDQGDVLMHMLRLRYQATLQEIRTQANAQSVALPSEIIDHLSYDELLERLHLLEGIREGLVDAHHGHTVSHESIKNMFDQWRKK